MIFAQPLVIASHNSGKVKEIRELFAPLSIEVQSASDVGADEPEETGSTFAENAELKARYVAAFCGQPTLSDDSGLAVPALDGAPGIYSARWAGANKDFSLAFARIRQELEKRALDTKNIDAYFICALCLCLPGGKVHHFEGRVDGTLTFPPRGEKGFGYDPIFIPKGRSVTFAEMEPDEKHRISHRAEAFAKFLTFMKRA